MQQIPHASTDVNGYDYKYPIKREFVSRFKNGKLFNIDYANLEFRILGLVTNEDSMTEAFLTGHDIHKANASLAFNVPYEEVTKAQRQAAKSIGLTKQAPLASNSYRKPSERATALSSW